MTSPVFSYGGQLIFEEIKILQNCLDKVLLTKQQIIVVAALAILSSFAVIYVISRSMKNHHVTLDETNETEATFENYISPKIHRNEIQEKIPEKNDVNPVLKSPKDGGFSEETKQVDQPLEGTLNSDTEVILPNETAVLNDLREDQMLGSLQMTLSEEDVWNNELDVEADDDPTQGSSETVEEEEFFQDLDFSEEDTNSNNLDAQAVAVPFSEDEQTEQNPPTQEGVNERQSLTIELPMETSLEKEVVNDHEIIIAEENDDPVVQNDFKEDERKLEEADGSNIVDVTTTEKKESESKTEDPEDSLSSAAIISQENERNEEDRPNEVAGHEMDVKDDALEGMTIADSSSNKGEEGDGLKVKEAVEENTNLLSLGTPKETEPKDEKNKDELFVSISVEEQGRLLEETNPSETLSEVHEEKKDPIDLVQKKTKTEPSPAKTSHVNKNSVVSEPQDIKKKFKRLEIEVIVKPNSNTKDNRVAKRKGEGSDVHQRHNQKLDGKVILKMKNGNGKTTSSNGVFKDGEFKRGLLESKYIELIFEDEQSEVKKLDGEFKQGKLNGWVKIIFKNGDSCMGQFTDGKLHGSVIIESSKGIAFTGNYENGRLKGDGNVITPTRRQVVEVNSKKTTDDSSEELQDLGSPVFTDRKPSVEAQKKSKNPGTLRERQSNRNSDSHPKVAPAHAGASSAQKKSVSTTRRTLFSILN